LHDREDEQLVVAICGGDKDAYATLVRRHSARVFAVCLGMLGNVGDSEDAAQEALLKGLTHIHTLRDGRQFGAWVSQIARNHCLDLLRTRKRRRELLQQNGETKTAAETGYTDLEEALERLPDQYRLPLMLYYFDGRDSRTVAAALNISRAGACTRLSRARKELRKLLEQGRKQHE
jgi:RNA polymerase sigma-70 factor (ECF subfamily)